MQDSTLSDRNTQFWWLRPDWVKFKVPYAGGEILLSDEYLDPGFAIDPKRHWYKFGSDREDARKIGDFSAFNGAALFVSEHGYKILKDLLLPCCRSFCVLCSKKPYYIVAVDRTYNPIDMRRSKFTEISNCTGPVENGISKVNSIVLNKDFSTEDNIFRIGHGRALSLEIIVSDHFKRLYEQSDLTGLFFKDVSFQN